MRSVPRRLRLASTARLTCRRELPRALTSLPVGLKHLVATTSAWRSPRISSPTITSEAPLLYWSALSKKLIPAAQLAALAQEMRMALTEVYEVATFYHHFEVVKEGEPAPPPLTVRVCDSISCELAGAQQLLKLNLGPGVRVIPAPCVGRCEVAPCVHVGENPVGNATADKLRAAVDKKQHDCPIEPYIGYQEYRKDGGYKLIRDCLAGKHQREALTKIMEDSGLRGLGGAGFPAGRKWRLVAAEPAPRVMAVNIDEGEPGTFKDRWYPHLHPHAFLH